MSNACTINDKDANLNLTMLGIGLSNMNKPQIHLRWMFNPKLGFPPCGFKLYRRKSNNQKPNCLLLDKLHSPDLSNKQLVYDIDSAGQLRIIFATSVGQIKLSNVTAVNNQSIPAILANTMLQISLPFPMPRVQLQCVIPAGQTLEISALAHGKLVLTKTMAGSGNLSPAIDMAAQYMDQVVIKGPLIQLATFCYWLCEEQAQDWDPVNQACGFALWLNSTPCNSQSDGFYPGDSEDVWEKVVKCRLQEEAIINQFFNDPTSGDKNFQGINKCLATMYQVGQWEGTDIPVGWNQFTAQGQAYTSSKDGSPTLQLAPYDLLLMQSVEPNLAKVLGLYWVDSAITAQGYYDYKITAVWPANTLLRLAHEVTIGDNLSIDPFFPVVSLPAHDITIFGLGPRLVEVKSALARVTTGLAFDPNNADILINFPHPVSNIQIFLQHEGLGATISACDLAHFTWLSDTLTVAHEGIVRLNGEQLQQVRLTGKAVTLLRIHYDCEKFNYNSAGQIEQSYLLCNLNANDTPKLAPPTGLTARSLQGLAQYDLHGQFVDHRFCAGLQWDRSSTSIYSPAIPVGYHIKRLSGGQEALITANQPVYVAADTTANQSFVFPPADLTQPIPGQPYYIDTVNNQGTYGYQIAGIDLFGRISPWSQTVQVNLLPSYPPPPTNVYAKFLDYESYHADQDVFTDQNLSAAEQTWLRTHRQSALVIRWQWPKNLQQQAPDAKGFNVFLQPGWLNTFRAQVNGVTILANNAGYQFNTTLVRPVSANSLVGEWLRQGKRLFKILGNTAGTAITITVAEPPLAVTITKPGHQPIAGSYIGPKNNCEFVLPVTRLAQDGGAALDYRKVETWAKNLTTVTLANQTQEAYEIFVTDVSFLDRNLLKQIKIDYAQIGVSTFNTMGNGSVSSPATVMVVYRQPPAALDYAGDIAALQATVVDVYGKSSITLEWPNPLQDGLKYYVFRTMDETLFQVDRDARRSRPASAYNNLSGTAQEKALFAAQQPDYTQFNNKMLRALANLPGNEGAFTRLHEQAFSIPASGNIFYQDDTLDGRSDNRYLYKIRLVDEVGNQSLLGGATPPIVIPRTTPPATPVVTQILGGDQKVSLVWLVSSNRHIARYRIYRTDLKNAARDIRLMQRIYDEPVGNQQTAITWSDVTAPVYTELFYRLTAVDEVGNESLPCKILSARAYRSTPPSAPDQIKAQSSIVTGQARVQLTWHTAEPFEVLVKRRTSNSNFWQVISPWLAPGTTQFTDTTVEPSLEYTYVLQGRTTQGVTTNCSEALTVSTGA